MSVKYIFVTGGVASGLGKGITAASLGRLLKARGMRVTIQKFDPYLNVDPGTMSPYQHGEVFVTEDGAETDLDIGHYERFIDENLNVNSNITAGKVYWSVISRERCGDFLGGTVQVIPHITNEIKERIFAVGNSNTDVVITEIGGTVGDIESQPFLEAIRQISTEVGKQDVLYVHVSLIINIPGTGEMKSKPTQHSVKELLSLGIQPDIIVCRSNEELPTEMRNKIALFCNVPTECVVQNITASTLYQIPLFLNDEGLDAVVCKRLNLETAPPDLDGWRKMVDNIKRCDKPVKIALVGKYVSLRDAYLSVAEALCHGGFDNGAEVLIEWIDSELLCAENAAELLAGCDGIIVPGGFGDRGIDGKIEAARYARESKIPFFGICLGMQMAVVEFARNVLNYADAHSAEFLPKTAHLVINLMENQLGLTKKGANMRLGSYPCKLCAGTISGTEYGEEDISERHRHRYEFNNDYREEMSKNGMIFAGLSPNSLLVEIIELKDHPWFVGVQFHPEFKSRPNRAHPLFRGFIRAALIASKNRPN